MLDPDAPAERDERDERTVCDSCNQNMDVIADRLNMLVEGCASILAIQMMVAEVCAEGLRLQLMTSSEEYEATDASARQALAAFDGWKDGTVPWKSSL